MSERTGIMNRIGTGGGSIGAVVGTAGASAGGASALLVVGQGPAAVMALAVVAGLGAAFGWKVGSEVDGSTAPAAAAREAWKVTRSFGTILLAGMVMAALVPALFSAGVVLAAGCAAGWVFTLGVCPGVVVFAALHATGGVREDTGIVELPSLMELVRATGSSVVDGTRKLTLSAAARMALAMELRGAGRDDDSVSVS